MTDRAADECNPPHRVTRDLLTRALRMTYQRDVADAIDDQVTGLVACGIVELTDRPADPVEGQPET